MTDDIDQLRERFRNADRELHDAQRDIRESESTITTIKERLTELGFDPEGDLDAQIIEKREKLDGVITEVETILADAETRHASTEDSPA